MHIFTDSSVNNTSGKAIGSFLILNSLTDNFTQNDIRSIELNSTSSTMAELLTIKHVLSLIDSKHYNLENVYLYTDCENFVNLINKRQYDDKLKSHRNYELYIELANLIDKYKVNMVWVKGHSKQANKLETYEKIFTYIDRHARRKLRELVSSTKQSIHE